jgi:hypothetical protein
VGWSFDPLLVAPFAVAALAATLPRDGRRVECATHQR